MFLVRIPAAGGLETVPVPDGSLPQTLLAELLHTDVTERMRIPVMPDAFAGEDFVLCYFLDARGGDRQLPANFLGTCFYHTGCPVCGDLLIAACAQDSDSAAVSGFTPEQTAALTDWLPAQFSVYLDGQ